MQPAALHHGGGLYKLHPVEPIAWNRAVSTLAPAKGKAYMPDLLGFHLG
jgi:hypothetical protein